MQLGKLLGELKIFGVDPGLWQADIGDREGAFLAEKHLQVCFREGLRGLESMTWGEQAERNLQA